MTAKFLIIGTSGNTADVTDQGALKTIAQEFSDVKKQTLTTVDAVNFFKPIPKKRFILTGIIINTNRDVGVNGALIDIYEANSIDSTVIIKSILSLEQIKNVTSAFLPLFTETTEGVFINAKSNDFQVNISVFGYFNDIK